jgi:hypothetical protein
MKFKIDCDNDAFVPTQRDAKTMIGAAIKRIANLENEIPYGRDVVSRVQRKAMRRERNRRIDHLRGLIFTKYPDLKHEIMNMKKQDGDGYP